MSNLPIILDRALDSNGDPISGAKLYFYETGTTTPKDTYSDRGLTSANTNPVVSDSNGYFGEIYLKSDGAYRVKLTDENDVQIYQKDTIWANRDQGDATPTRLKQVASNPLDYGAVGDGAADESSEVQSAIDAATKVIDLLGKTFRCDSQISLSAGQELINGTLDFSQCTDTEYILIHGDGLAILTTATVVAGNPDLTAASGTGFAQDDVVLIMDDAASWSSGVQVGELHKLASISGTALKLNEVAVCSYTSKTFWRVDTIDDVTLRKVTIIGNNSTGSYTSIEAKFARNLIVEDCIFEGYDLAAVLLQTCADVKIRNCFFKNAYSTSITIKQIDGALNTKITGCDFQGVDVAFSFGNCTNQDVIANNTLIAGCVFGYSNDYNYFYAPTTSNKVVDCVFYDGPGFICNASDIEIDNCEFYDVLYPIQATDSVTLSLVNVRSLSYKFTNNKMNGVSISMPRFGSATTASGSLTLVISGNKFRDIDTNGALENSMDLLEINPDEVTWELVEIVDNDFPFVSIRIIPEGSATTEGKVENVIISRNKLYSPGVDSSYYAPVYIAESTNGTVDKVLVSENLITFGGDSPLSGVYVNKYTKAHILNNSIIASGDDISSAINLEPEASSESIVSGNLIDLSGATVTTAPGVEIDGTSATTSGTAIVENNKIINCTRGIITEDIEFVSFNGNVINTASSDGLKATDAEYLSVVGNSMSGIGGYGIHFDDQENSSQDTLIVSGNTLYTGTNNFLYANPSSASLLFSVVGNVSRIGDTSSIKIVTGAGAEQKGVISNNYLQISGDTSCNVDLAGNGAGDVEGVLINGNRMLNGDYYLKVANAANCGASYNALESMANASYSGAGVTEAGNIAFA